MSKAKILALALGGIAIAVFVYLSTSAEPDSPEEMVRKVLTDMARSASAKQPRGVLDHVSERFRGQGGMDRDGLRGLLFVELRRGNWTRVVLHDTDVLLQGPALAEVTTRAFLARGDGPLPTNAEGWILSASLELEDDGKWRVVSASYRSSRRR